MADHSLSLPVRDSDVLPPQAACECAPHSPGPAGRWQCTALISGLAARGPLPPSGRHGPPPGAGALIGGRNCHGSGSVTETGPGGSGRLFDSDSEPFDSAS